MGVLKYVPGKRPNPQIRSALVFKLHLKKHCPIQRLDS